MTAAFQLPWVPAGKLISKARLRVFTSLFQTLCAVGEVTQAPLSPTLAFSKALVGSEHLVLYAQKQSKTKTLGVGAAML